MCLYESKVNLWRRPQPAGPCPQLQVDCVPDTLVVFGHWDESMYA